MLSFYTGLKQEIFEWLFKLVNGKVKTITPLSSKDNLLVISMKVKLGLYNKDVAFRFNVSPNVISKIYRTWLPILAENVKFLIIWPEREALRSNLTKSFKLYKNCVSIIDCTEIFIDRPLSLNARAQTWSNYKNHNTINL